MQFVGQPLDVRRLLGVIRADHDDSLGERLPLPDYIRATQGCGAAGWPADYTTARADQARHALAALGIAWGPHTETDLAALEGPIATADAPDAIRQAATDYETAVRHTVDSTAPFHLTIETVDLDAYWAYWLDGAGHHVRLRINLRNATFTKTTIRQFALHEVLGHGLQGATWTHHATTHNVPWIRLSSVHAPQQVLLEGLAQALPLFITPDDPNLTARVRLAHYTQLVRAELHRAINHGATPTDCATHAHQRIPWWTDTHIADALTDRSLNPQLRTYLWAYPAGLDWFTHLAETNNPKLWEPLLQAAYQNPLTPHDLTTLWPHGPTIGGPGT